MKKNKRFIAVSLAIILVLSLTLTPTTFAGDVRGNGVAFAAPETIGHLFFKISNVTYVAHALYYNYHEQLGLDVSNWVNTTTFYTTNAPATITIALYYYGKFDVLYWGTNTPPTNNVTTEQVVRQRPNAYVENFSNLTGNVVLNTAGTYLIVGEGFAFYVIVGGTPPDVSHIQNQPQQITVMFNDNILSFDQPPIMENNRVLVPFRTIFEAHGAEISWNPQTQTVTAVRDELTITLTIGSNILTKNGVNIQLDVPVQIVGDRTLVPVRAVAESFGSTVEWEPRTYLVMITT